MRMVNVNVIALVATLTAFVTATVVSSSSQPTECQMKHDGGAIPLLLADNSGLNMVLCEAGLKYLREDLANDELYVTSVVGPARKGKSFFLNNLASIAHPQHKLTDDHEKQPQGFSVGHTAQGHTKGFWLSPKSDDSVVYSSVSGRKVTALFMDTEGSGATGNFKSYDPKICAVAAIFSSNLIYNVMSEISMDNLDFLAKITLFDDYLSQKKNASFPSPPISWAVQNWEFSLDTYDPPTALGYLKSVLQKKDISSNLGSDEIKQYEEYNALISTIIDKFSPFDTSISRAIPPIILFDEPSQKTKKMHLTQLSFSEYDQGYQDQLTHLRQMIRNGAKPKEFSKGKYLTGKSFAQNLETLTVALNQLTHVGDALIKAVAKEAAEMSFEGFKTESAQIPRPSSSQTQFNDQLSWLEKKHVQRFESGCLGGELDAINKEMKAQLIKDINSERRVLHELNFNNQIEYCGREASQHIDAIKNISNTRDSKFNKCGLKALVVVDSLTGAALTVDNDIDASETKRKRDTSAEKLLQLQRCYDSNIAHYSQMCAPDWCDVNSSNAHEGCLQPLRRTLMEYTARSTDALDIQKKELAQMGFQKLLFSVLLLYVTLYVCGKVTPRVISDMTNVLKSGLFFILMSLGALANLQTYKWLQVMVCDFFNEWWFVESTTCLYYLNELPNIVGALYNIARLYYATIMDTGRTVVEDFIKADDKLGVLTSWSMQGLHWAVVWAGLAEEGDVGGLSLLSDDVLDTVADELHNPHSQAMRELVHKIFWVMAALIMTLVLLRCRKRR